MKRISSILIFILHLLVLQADPQESAETPPRTPEQEATMQTNKMRQELNLSSEQEREIYTINLRHARERQTSVSRSDALKRVKTKEQEFQRVLTHHQYERLQEKRMDYSPQGIDLQGHTERRTRPVTNPQRLEDRRLAPSTDYRRSNELRNRPSPLPTQRNTVRQPVTTDRQSGTTTPAPRSSGSSDARSTGNTGTKSSGNSGSRTSSESRR